MNKNRNTQRILLMAMFASLTLIATLFVRFPIPNAQGYVNGGDMILMLVGLLMGPTGGFFVGAIGSALADMLAGYAIYIPFTFVIKGIEGFLVGWIFQKTDKKVLALLLAGLWMAVGYFLVEWMLYGFTLALVAFPMNLLQGLAGAGGALLLYRLALPLFNKRFN